MTVFIDQPRWPAHNTLWSHLVSDTSLEELHAFAAAQGLPGRAFDLDHYDIPARRYDDLVRAGAIPVSGRDLVLALRASGLRFSQKERRMQNAEKTATVNGNDTDRRTRFLAAYDSQLRGDAEALNAITVTSSGPLRLVTFAGGRGFVTYRHLTDLGADALSRLITDVMTHFRSDPDITRIVWKVRSHDIVPGLHDALVARGFNPDEPESIMIGFAAELAVEVPLPDGAAVRRVTEPSDVRAMSAMQDAVFGEPASTARAESLIARLTRRDGMELWVGEVNGEIVSAGRLDPVAGSEFAGIWGGATKPEWRGRGIYRAVTAARARAALVQGKILIHSDSTEFSRPILERSGMVAVSTTTPYLLLLPR